MIVGKLLGLFDDLAGSSSQIPPLRRLMFACVLHVAVNSPDAKSRADALRKMHKKQRAKARRTSSQSLDVTAEQLPPSLPKIPAFLFERLENIASIERGQSQIRNTKPGKHPLVVTAEARSTSDSWDFEGPSTIVPLVSSTGHGDASLKRIHYQEGRYAVGNILAVIQPLCPNAIQARFLYEYLSSFKDELLVSRMVGTANVSLTIDKLKEVPVPLVSGKALQRIDKLMALCDRLEAQEKEREAKHAVLARAALARFDETPMPANLGYLFHNAYTIAPADLRKSILAMAVQGKLVPQDSADKPALSIVEKIAAQKAQMIAAKEIRQGKVSRPHSAAAAPIRVPAGWMWVTVDSIFFKVTDGTHFTPKYANDGLRFVSAKDIVTGKLSFDACKFITREEHDRLFKRCNPGYHDILISKSGSIGTVVLVEDRGEFSLFESLALLKFDQTSLDAPFLVYALQHACATLTAGHIRGMGVKHLHLDILRGLEFALPPLAEQRRIVAKVDALMALVDRLEAQLAESQTLAGRLMEAIVAELTGARQQRRERMKAPKIEIVSMIRLKKRSKIPPGAQLAPLLAKRDGELDAKALWALSKLPIHTFYKQLRQEIHNGWIAKPEEPTVRERG